VTEQGVLAWGKAFFPATIVVIIVATVGTQPPLETCLAGNSLKMPKRKHSDIEEDSLSGFEHREDRKGNLQATRLRHKFERGSQLLYRALKTARGFERQKLGRRQKVAKQNDDGQALQRLDAEVQALKVSFRWCISIAGKLYMYVYLLLFSQNLDLSTTAEKHLFKQLVKSKLIADSPAFARLKSSTSIPIHGPRDVAEANVAARLFKSNPVKNAMPGIMNGIREILGLGDIKVKNAERSTKNATVGLPPNRETTVGGNKSKVDRAYGPSHGENGVSGDVSMDDAEQEIDFSRLDSRLSSSSDDSGTEAENGSAMRGVVRSQQARYDPVADMSLSPSLSGSSESPPSRGKSGRLASDPNATPKKTTFLPALMMGGYWSGSESGADEDAAEDRPRRKNRMGQQARRALWEKKYGTKANHLQSQRQEKEHRDRDWDLRKGAIDDNHDSRRKNKGRGGSKAQPSRGLDRNPQRGENTRTENTAQRKRVHEEKPLHPSWEAARRAKEQKAQASFCGKKIVFD
jgi:BUD22